MAFFPIELVKYRIDISKNEMMARLNNNVELKIIRYAGKSNSGFIHKDTAIQNSRIWRATGNGKKKMNPVFMKIAAHLIA